MDNPEKIEMASLEDLLGSSEDKTKRVFIKSIGKHILVRRLSMGDIAKINAFNRSKGWEDDAFRTTIGILQRGIIEPKISYSQAEGLDVDKATEIVNEISAFSGWTEEAIGQARNLLEETTESI